MRAVAWPVSARGRSAQLQHQPRIARDGAAERRGASCRVARRNNSTVSRMRIGGAGRDRGTSPHFIGIQPMASSGEGLMANRLLANHPTPVGLSMTTIGRPHRMRELIEDEKSPQPPGNIVRRVALRVSSAAGAVVSRERSGPLPRLTSSNISGAESRVILARPTGSALVELWRPRRRADTGCRSAPL